MNTDYADELTVEGNLLNRSVILSVWALTLVGIELSTEILTSGSSVPMESSISSGRYGTVEL